MMKNLILNMDVTEGLRNLESSSADIVLIDPPYNIGYDFGNNKCKKDTNEYVKWALSWIKESSRVLKPSGTMFIYGFSEILAHLSVNLDMEHRWLIWHYTNKSVPSLKFWQRSHESIICAWKDSKQRVFNLDEVREPYTEAYKKGYSSGKVVRKSSKGRFQSGNQDTFYKPHDKGALPRDVIKNSTLAGGSGINQRIRYCKDCKDSFITKKESQLHDGHDVLKHPTQKPFDLTKKLFLSSKPEEGGLVVIPFAGSGSEALVAKSLGLDFVGFEYNPEYCDMANNLLTKDLTV
tara:strand:- start:647 stop:1522 length:876 start_codon:yes stop_codon:yes gene_type:complete